MKFTECLNDTWDYFFGDPSNISRFQAKNHLSDNLISEFITNDSGDLVVKEGVLIPLSGIRNYPYHIFFQIDSNESVFKNGQQDLQFKRSGYLLEVIHQEIYLMTVPYLKNWTKNNGIKSLRTNGIRPKVHLENGTYTVKILGGETLQENGWEPTIEFLIQKAKVEVKFDVENVNFEFEIKSREY